MGHFRSMDGKIGVWTPISEYGWENQSVIGMPHIEAITPAPTSLCIRLPYAYLPVFRLHSIILPFTLTCLPMTLDCPPMTLSLAPLTLTHCNRLRFSVL